MKICVPKEIAINEKRVATTPDVAQSLQQLGFEVSIESNAGLAAGFPDHLYVETGVTVITDIRQNWRSGDIILKVRAPTEHPVEGFHEASLLRSNQILISFLWPAKNETLLELLAKSGASVLAMDEVPRISRAQKLDALSAMANISGYRAVIEAANHFGRFFTGQITAAGKVPPAKILVIGAGVAGLAAIGAAGSMGALVRAFDTRPDVKEQIESMGAEFLMLDFEEDGSGEGGYATVMSEEFIRAEMDLFARQAADVDIIITTALIPGKPAPKLITADMIRSMRSGSVLVDLAAEQGGNCVLTKAGEIVSEGGVHIIGYTDLPSRMAAQSSQLYASTLRNLLTELCPDKNGEIEIDMEDEVIRAVTVIHSGIITWPPSTPPTATVSVNKGTTPAPTENLVDLHSRARIPAMTTVGVMAAGILAIVGLGAVAPPSFMAHFIVFVLSIFIGWQVIWNVTPALHTPLMSVTNAISGIIVIGALLQTSSSSNLALGLAVLSVFIASINVSGGFLVTQRMLGMFHRE